jgi:hypothetical protein
MSRDNNTLLLYVLIGAIVVFAVYCIWGKKHSEGYDPGNEQKASKSQKPDMELIDQGDGGRVSTPPDSFELIGVASDEPAFQLGFGMGPGLYGSGRAESSMVGN